MIPVRDPRGRRARTLHRFWLLLSAGFALSGCASRPLTQIDPPAASVELVDTPFFAQTEHHCGPAALATVLAAQGLDATPEALAPWVYVPGREGSLQAEMLAAARRFDRVPVRLGSDPQALIGALERGHPVLVLQNLGLRRWPRWHYAVVIGYDPRERAFILRSGTTRREVLAERRFVASWERADRWAVVLAEPDAIPTATTVQDWLAGAAPFESLGRLAVAEQAYRAAITRWPQSALPWQAISNVDHALGRTAAAERALRRAVELDDQAVVARNNLANLLLARGCVEAAQRQVDTLRQVPPRFATALEQTREKIRLAAASGAADRAADCG